MPARSQTNEHRLQRSMVMQLAAQGYTPILNACSKEDPAGLADFGATNLDIQKFDPSLGIDLTKAVPNYVHGDVCHMPFQDKSYKLVVLGEALEHFLPFKAVEVLTEIKRVLMDDGRIFLTFPKDPRPWQTQHNPPVNIEFVPGAFAQHVTVWEDDMLLDLFGKVGLKEIHRQNTTYLLGGCCLGGLGLILEKA